MEICSGKLGYNLYNSSRYERIRMGKNRHHFFAQGNYRGQHPKEIKQRNQHTRKLAQKLEEQILSPEELQLNLLRMAIGSGALKPSLTLALLSFLMINQHVLQAAAMTTGNSSSIPNRSRLTSDNYSVPGTNMTLPDVVSSNTANHELNVWTSAQVSQAINEQAQLVMDSKIQPSSSTSPIIPIQTHNNRADGIPITRVEKKFNSALDKLYRQALQKYENAAKAAAQGNLHEAQILATQLVQLDKSDDVRTILAHQNLPLSSEEYKSLIAQNNDAQEKEQFILNLQSMVSDLMEFKPITPSPGAENMPELQGVLDSIKQLNSQLKEYKSNLPASNDSSLINYLSNDRSSKGQLLFKQIQEMGPILNKPIPGIPRISDFKELYSGIGGHSGATVFQERSTGDKYSIKPCTENSITQCYFEIIGSTLYQTLLGEEASLEPVFVVDTNTGLQIASKWNDGFKSLDYAESVMNQHIIPGSLTAAAVSVLLGDGDVNQGNVGILLLDDDANYVKIDFGSAFDKDMYHFIRKPEWSSYGWKFEPDILRNLLTPCSLTQEHALCIENLIKITESFAFKRDPLDASIDSGLIQVLTNIIDIPREKIIAAVDQATTRFMDSLRATEITSKISDEINEISTMLTGNQGTKLNTNEGLRSFDINTARTYVLNHLNRHLDIFKEILDEKLKNNEDYTDRSSFRGP